MHDLTNAPQTMTSREIAELTGKRHDHVLRDARAMLVELHGEGGVPRFGATHTDPQNGQAYPVLALPKRETLILVSGYNVAMRAKIIDRWQELEEQARNPIAALSRVDLLKLALDSEEKRLVLESEVKTLAPKAAALDRIALETEGAVCLRVAAKLVQVPEKQFMSFLAGEGWIFRHHYSHTWQGYSDKEKAGLLELKRTSVTRDDGSSKTVEQVLVTPRGQAKAAELIERKAPWLRKAPNHPPPNS
jgi:phage regulator Rha-like protein